MDLGHGKTLTGVGFDDVVVRTTAALKEQGFGVLTTIDVKKTLREKIDVNFRRYTILGACHPHSAHAVLTADPDVGLLLPCNVVVWEDGDAVVVKVVNPKAMFALVDNADLLPVVQDIDSRLRRALEHI